MCCNSHRSSAEIDRIVREAQLGRNRLNARRRELYALKKLVAEANAISLTPLVIDQPTKVEAPTKERDLVLA